ncbi:MAG: T9SS type A sorting domain-containing protein [Bacteroidota bacterium]
MKKHFTILFILISLNVFAQIRNSIDTLNNSIYQANSNYQSSKTLSMAYETISSPTILISLDSIKHASCNGSHDGYIRIKDTMRRDGLSIVDYLWSTGDTGIRIRNLVAGTYTVTATDGYGCRDTASFTINTLNNPIHLPTISYQPYTTCDMRADSVVFTPYLPTPPSPLPIPYYPPIPHYTYTWSATNIDSTFPSSGSILGGTSLRHSFPIHFADSLVGSTITIRATDSGGCYDEIRIWIEPCCVRSERLISNIRLSQLDSSLFFRDTFGYYNFTSTSFRINGIFTIDRNCTFTSGDFYMEPYSQIIILPNLNVLISQKNIVACDTTMWKGILVGRNSVLNVENNCRIYDALTAIRTELRSSFHVLNTDFNRNWIDIDVGGNVGMINTSTLFGSHLFSHNETVEYFGNTPPKSGGRCWAPHREEQSYIGINVLNNRLLTIGDLLLDPSKLNIIEDKNYGIYASASSLTVVNNLFNNMRIIRGLRGMPNSAGDALYFEAINDLPPNPKEINVSYNKFKNINHASIYLYGATVQGTIRDNNMVTNYGILSNNLGSRYSTITPSCTFNPLNIWRDTIEYSSSGIKLDNTYRIDIDISHNNRLLGPNYIPMSTIPSTTGISISSIAAMSQNNPRFRITDNFVRNGKYGIQVTNYVPAMSPLMTPVCPFGLRSGIIDNVIQTLDASMQGYVGIMLTNANILDVRCNVINGLRSDVSSGRLNKIGIYLNSARQNNIVCNTIDSLYKGFTYFNKCGMDGRLGGNTFSNQSYFIYGANATANIGDQTDVGGLFPANRMVIPGASRNAIYNNGRTYSYAIRTLTDFDPRVRGDYGGSSIVTPLVTPLTSDINCLSCTAVGAGGSGGSHLQISDVVDYANELTSSVEASTGIDEQGNFQLGEELLYDLLANDSSLLSNDSLLDFYLTNKYEHTGMLDQIKQLIFNKNFIDANGIIRIISENSEVEEVNSQIIKIYADIEEREYLLNNQFDIIYDTLNNDTSIISKIDNKFIHFSFTDEELLKLQEIANYCPIRYGQAVYMARVLLNTQSGHENDSWDDEDICIYGVNYRRSNITKENSLDVKYILYPNPTSDYINYAIINTDKIDSNINYRIEISDIQGSQIKSIYVPQHTISGKINLSNLSNGLYIVNIYSDKVNLYHQKIFVNK